MKKEWEVYIIETQSGRLYTGIAKSSERRFSEHLSGGVKAAKFFRLDAPKKIVYLEKSHDRSSALKREYQIKSFTKSNKLKLIKGKKCPAHLARP